MNKDIFFTCILSLENPVNLKDAPGQSNSSPRRKVREVEKKNTQMVNMEVVYPRGNYFAAFPETGACFSKSQIPRKLVEKLRKVGKVQFHCEA